MRNKITQCDIAIIGGGISGLYAAWKLSEIAEFRKKSIAVFEASHRLGGRIETTPLANFQAETGSMRIEIDIQTSLKKLIADLNLSTVETFENYGVAKVPVIAKAYHLNSDEMNKTPLELLYLAICKILHCHYDDITQMTRYDFNHIYKHGKFNGKYLWEMGWWELLSHVLSYEAIKYIINHGHFYHFVHENLNAAAELVFFIRILKTNNRLKNIKSGMINLIHALENNVNATNIPIFKTHKLLNVKNHQSDIELTFNNDLKIIAKKCILTIPLPNLIELTADFPRNISQYFSSSKQMNLMKCIFVVNNPWWKNIEANFEAHRIPTRELHYYNSDQGTGMVMLYMDSPVNKYWRALFPNEPQPETRVTQDQQLISHFCRYMPCKPANVIAHAVRDWGKPPYSGAISFWKRGYPIYDIVQQIQSCRLIDSPANTDNIFICGDSFSDYQGFIEGSLRTTDEVIEKLLIQQCGA